MTTVFRALLVAVVMVVTTAVAFAQTSSTSGSVTIAGDLFPNRDNTTELRSRVFVEELLDPSPQVRLALSGFAEGLVARRPTIEAPHGEQVNDAAGGVLDASVTWKTKHADLLAGFARLSWGRLDELQPTDVVNPLDASRFFFESRSEARLPSRTRASSGLPDGQHDD